MTVYLDRNAWTSSDASGVRLTGSELVGIAVHYPGTTQAVIGDPGRASIARRLRGYRNYHVGTKGWRDIGYNFAIDQAGRVWILRSTAWHGNMVGAHAASSSNPRANHQYVGVLFVIGNDEAPSSAAIEAFRDWYHVRFLPRWPGRTDVRGHRQVPGAATQCPGDHAIALINDGILTQLPEDDMAISDDDARKIARYVWREDGIIQAPDFADKDNPHWIGDRYIREIRERVTHAAMRRAVIDALETQRPFRSEQLGEENSPKTLRWLNEWAGMMAFINRQAARRTEAKIDAVLEVVKTFPDVDAEALAQKIAEAVERLDAEAVAEQLEINVKDEPS